MGRKLAKQYMFGRAKVGPIYRVVRNTRVSRVPKSITGVAAGRMFHAAGRGGDRKFVLFFFLT